MHVGIVAIDEFVEAQCLRLGHIGPGKRRTSSCMCIDGSRAIDRVAQEREVADLWLQPVARCEGEMPGGDAHRAIEHLLGKLSRTPVGKLADGGRPVHSRERRQQARPRGSGQMVEDPAIELRRERGGQMRFGHVMARE